MIPGTRLMLAPIGALIFSLAAIVVVPGETAKILWPTFFWALLPASAAESRAFNLDLSKRAYVAIVCLAFGTTMLSIITR